MNTSGEQMSNEDVVVPKSSPAFNGMVEALKRTERWITTGCGPSPLGGIRDALAKAEASGNCAEGWRDIETAPKDGSHVMLAVTDDEPGYVAEGYYEEDGDRWYAANTHWTDQFDGQLFPSHWRPLPAPPGMLSSTPELNGNGGSLSGTNQPDPRSSLEIENE